MTIISGNFIEIYLILLGILFILFFIIVLIYWIKLINYIFLREPKYWEKLYISGIFPRWKKFFRFYYSNEDFKDEKIKEYKRKFRIYLFISLVIFLLILLSIIAIGIFSAQ